MRENILTFKNCPHCTWVNTVFFLIFFFFCPSYKSLFIFVRVFRFVEKPFYDFRIDRVRSRAKSYQKKLSVTNVRALRSERSHIFILYLNWCCARLDISEHLFNICHSSENILKIH